jgi:CMP-N-acetylneuraminic acid synthetase
METLAVIPARGGSKRIAGKNVRPFLGVPLVAWTMRFARTCSTFSRVAVSTDSEEIADIARSEGVEVHELRPAALATDTATSVDVALHALAAESIDHAYEALALLQPTSPARLLERWDTARELISRGHDAAVGVAPAHDHPLLTYTMTPEATMEWFVPRSSEQSLRSQDLPPAYAIAGCLYLIRSDVLREQRTFFPAGTAGVLCDAPYESLDIDTEADWVAAEAIANYYGQKPCQRS